MRNVSGLWFCLLLAGTADAAAQPIEPIGPVVADVRGALAGFKAESGLASDLAVEAANLPTRGLGLAAGGHWYPLRRGRVTFGVGAELVVARGSRSSGEPDLATEGPTVTTRLSAFSPQVSLNFGKNDGWSYISGGIGRARLTTERDDVPVAGDPGGVRASNYGGGARWFTSPRVAFTFDVRFYTINAREPAGMRPGYPRTRFMVISVGASVR